MRVGAVDDRLEREADRVADAIVAATRSGIRVDRHANELGLLGAADRPTRIRRAERADVIRRSPYLSNADDLIYKDSFDDTIELAFLGKQFNTNVFVAYQAVHDLRRWAKLAARPKGGGRQRTKHSRRDEPYPTGGGVPGQKQQRGGGPAVDWDDYHAVTQQVTPGSYDWPNLVADLGTVYGYGKKGRLEILVLEDDLKAQVIRSVLSPGPKSMPGGGGSRLPDPAGTVYTRGPLTRDLVLDHLGVDPGQRGAYARLTVTALDDNAFIERSDQAVEAHENVYSYTNPDLGVWLFYISTVQARRSANSRIQVAGASFFSDDEFLDFDDTNDDGRDAARRMESSFNALAAPPLDSGWIPGTQLAAARARGKGQAAAMERWNALGAAAYGNKFLRRNHDLTQSWEWLHVRGAQIGGATTGGNLVPGVYATNSAMIPYEAMIKSWATQGPHSFEAKFVVSGVTGVFANRIELWIGARGHPVLGDLRQQLLAAFDPISGRVVDKMAGEIVKRRADQRVLV